MELEVVEAQEKEQRVRVHPRDQVNHYRENRQQGARAARENY